MFLVKRRRFRFPPNDRWRHQKKKKKKKNLQTSLSTEKGFRPKLVDNASCCFTQSTDPTQKARLLATLRLVSARTKGRNRIRKTIKVCHNTSQGTGFVSVDMRQEETSGRGQRRCLPMVVVNVFVIYQFGAFNLGVLSFFSFFFSFVLSFLLSSYLVFSLSLFLTGSLSGRSN